MLLVWLFCGLALFSALVAWIWKYLHPRADGFEMVMAAFFAFGGSSVLAILVLAASSAGTSLDKAKSQAKRQCGDAKANLFVDQDRQAVAFTCAGDSRMRVVKFGSGAQ